MLWAFHGWAQCAGGPVPRAPAIPSGYLQTSGNQIVDANGTPVRIVAVGWNGMNTTNGRLNGIEGPFKGYEENLAQMRSLGFNAVRVSWTDASLRNPSDMATYRRLVRAAGAAGIRIVFDHHQNEGTTSARWACAAQQVNGLWFDLGPGTDGTNGCGDRGTVTADMFRQNSAAFAARWAGDPTVIGFDLNNEPVHPKITWGDGGLLDIHKMAAEVGNAIHDVNPGALIIVEGPFNYRGSFAGTGIAPEGDLTAVRNKPVVLRIPNKVVYSVHEYPKEVSDFPVDSGPAYIRQMNAVWGYLVSENIAPVWIGEMGASMKSPASHAWADTLLLYMKGTAPGGLTLGAGQLGVGGTWWLWGNLDHQNPNGYLQPDGKPRPEQARVVRQMMSGVCPAERPSASTTVGQGEKR
jgi:aryl-phospho-beta-D-glucosidase BglC (GH1 family)